MNRLVAAGAILTPAIHAFWEDVERIAEPFGGGVDECKLMGDDHVPFSRFRR
jgi:hypothetical protein